MHKRDMSWFYAVGIITVVVVIIMLLSGCEKIYTSRANPDRWLTPAEFNNLPEPNQANFQKKFVIGERIVKYIDAAGEVIEKAAPVAITLADLFWPGAGLGSLIAAGITGVVRLRRKHGREITKARSIVGHLQGGAAVIFDAIEEYKKAFPDG